MIVLSLIRFLILLGIGLSVSVFPRYVPV